MDQITKWKAKHPEWFEGARVEISTDYGAGWVAILDDALSRIEAVVVAERAVFEIIQIKQKFARLRIYYRIEPEELREQIGEIIDGADAKSAETCLKCGRPGRTVRKADYFKTLCEICEDTT